MSLHAVGQPTLILECANVWWSDRMIAFVVYKLKIKRKKANKYQKGTENRAMLKWWKCTKSKSCTLGIRCDLFHIVCNASSSTQRVVCLIRRVGVISLIESYFWEGQRWIFIWSESLMIGFSIEFRMHIVHWCSVSCCQMCCMHTQNVLTAVWTTSIFSE